MTRRRMLMISTVALVGGGLGWVGAVSAQATKSGVKEKVKGGVIKAETKWESLTPEQQQQVAQKLKTDVAQAREKWVALTPEQQQQYLAAGKAEVQKGRKKWQELPAGTPSTPPSGGTTTTAPAKQ